MAPAVPRTAPDHLSVPHTDDRSQYMALVSRTFIMASEDYLFSAARCAKRQKKKEDTTYWWQLVLLLHRPHTQTLQRIEQKIHSTNTVKTQQSNELPKTCKRYHW